MKSALFALALFLGLAGPSAAQPYPNKPIKVIVPYPAGGNADITARVVSRKMSDILGVPVVVENRAGANGMIGTDIVAKSAPDGYTLIAPASGPIVINPVLYSKVPYDSVKDLQPISQLTSFQYVLIVPAASPIKSIQDLVAQGKAQPGKLSYGSTGIGGGPTRVAPQPWLISWAASSHLPSIPSQPPLH
jgi:tripartite-type tricarboxylate transporter receptor subunit TctC